MTDIIALKSLLDEFNKIPKIQNGLTFMQICRYPRNRYEEICSRILQFFFDPKAEHNLGILWLKSLFNSIEDAYQRKKSCTICLEKSTLYYNISDITIEREVKVYENKRMDLLINTKTFAVCIENKINADVYNPLDIYKKYMDDKFNKMERFCIVLSLYPVKETEKLNENGFINITYSELFTSVKKNLGEYISNAKSEYITYMLDFIKTLSNMNGNISEQEIEFFKMNGGKIDELIERYKNYKSYLWDNLLAEVEVLCNKLSDRMQIQVKAYEGWLPSVGLIKDKYRIGLEGHYQEVNGNQFGRFNYFIKTWDEDSWNYFKDKVFNKFGNGTDFSRDRNMTIYHLDTIDGNDIDSIVEKFSKAYSDLKEIVDNA